MLQNFEKSHFTPSPLCYVSIKTLLQNISLWSKETYKICSEYWKHKKHSSDFAKSLQNLAFFTLEIKHPKFARRAPQEQCRRRVLRTISSQNSSEEYTLHMLWRQTSRVEILKEAPEVLQNFEKSHFTPSPLCYVSIKILLQNISLWSKETF